MFTFVLSTTLFALSIFCATIAYILSMWLYLRSMIRSVQYELFQIEEVKNSGIHISKKVYVRLICRCLLRLFIVAFLTFSFINILFIIVG